MVNAKMTKRLGSVLYHPLTALEDHDEDVDRTSLTTGSTSFLVQSPKVLFKLPFKTLAILTAILPLFGFFFCLFWSIFIQFQLTTGKFLKHCTSSY